MAKTYSNEQRIAALASLAANGGNISKTSRETGVSRITLRGWQASELNDLPEVATIKKGLVDSYREKLRKARESALDRMLELMPVESDLHKVTGAAKILSEISITQDVIDEYNRPEASASAASGAALSEDKAATLN